MKILHTSDWHLGQIIYQTYDREEEFLKFFAQLRKWCKDEQPHALLVSGDIYDNGQPSAASRKLFSEQLVALHKACKEMKIVVIAGNHDSASRLEAESALWECINVTVLGCPVANTDDKLPVGWQERYIVRIPGEGYIVAMPYFVGKKTEMLQLILDYVSAENAADRLPVVLMAHQAVAGSQMVGTETGNLSNQEIADFGQGFDYLALGHIHRPHLIGEHIPDTGVEEEYESPLVCYSGSALHVSADEAFPHSVSVVELKARGEKIRFRRIRIEELYHFYTLPEDKDACIMSIDQLKEEVRRFIDDEDKKGYFRLRLDNSQRLGDISTEVEELIKDQPYKRYNPRPIWVGADDAEPVEQDAPDETIDVATLQQMTDPVAFIKLLESRTPGKFKGLDFDTLEKDFEEIQNVMRQIEEEKKKNEAKKANRKKQDGAVEDTADTAESDDTDESEKKEEQL